MCCCRWEYVPLWGWWKTLLSIWKRFRLSGTKIFYLQNLKLENLMILALSVNFYMKNIYKKIIHIFAGGRAIWNPSSVWSSHQTNRMSCDKLLIAANCLECTLDAHLKLDWFLLIKKTWLWFLLLAIVEFSLSMLYKLHALCFLLHLDQAPLCFSHKFNYLFIARKDFRFSFYLLMAGCVLTINFPL